MHKSYALYKSLLIIIIIFSNCYLLLSGRTDFLSFFLLEMLLFVITAFFIASYTESVTNKPIPVEPSSEELLNRSLSKEESVQNLKQNLQYEAILANIGDGLIISNKKGKIITFNKAAESMLGWSKEEAIGRSLQEVMMVQYEKDNSVIYDKHLLRDEALFLIRKDQTKFIAAIKVTSFGNETELHGTITLFRDITLEQNIDQMKNEFITLASHQLKTPLSTIRWYILMLLKGDVGKLLPQQEKFAETIKTATFRMVDLVNALLNISRIESGRIIIEPLPTDIRLVIKDVIADMQTSLDERNQKVELSFPENVPLINLDPRFIRQIYLNLLTNASKYSPNGKAIEIKLTVHEKDIESSVKDSGYGIPQKDREKMFSKFYRGDNIVTKVPDGTGLGMYLVKAIITLFGGKIWYESEETKGTTFSFTLPLIGTPAKKGVVALDNDFIS